MNAVCIVSAKRTPVGRFLGSLARHTAVDLAVAAGEAALEDIDRDAIDQVIVGNILAAGQGMNMARQVGIRLGLPVGVPAFTVNMMCASGLQAIRLGEQAIRSGEADLVLCGGSESMSQAPHLVPRSRSGIKLGDGKLVDAILRDGLVDSFDGRHMALTAEELARDYGIARTEQDAFAAASQERFARAEAEGIFDAERIAVASLETDEHPRPDTTRESLADLSPAFDPEGTVTAGNASGINDGAALVVLANLETAKSRGWPVLAEIAASTAIGCEPARMGLGPVLALRALLEGTATDLSDHEQIEINEAFAGQVLACLRDLALSPDRINPHGGAIAVGHPIGASGARLVTHLAHRIAAGDVGSALASLCVGGGMGAAMALRRVP